MYKMNSVLLSIALLFPIILHAQKKNIKKSVWKSEIGLLGIWQSYEMILSEKFTILNEAGIEITNWSINKRFLRPRDNSFIMPFVLSTDPRFYYAGLDRKDAGFLSLKTSFRPPISLISNSIESDISIVPTIGTRTKINEHLFYEIAGGVGYRYIFKTKNTGWPRTGSDFWAFNIVLRIAYAY